MYIREFTEGIVDSAVQFHKQLNPLLWQGAVLKPQVRFKLLQIAKNFVTFIDIPELLLTDITISGSNAAYSYTQQSDLDLHLIVTVPPDRAVLLKPLYDAKKNQYNFIHDIKIKGVDVEVYVQPEDQDHHSLGIYSVLDNKWIKQPTMSTVKIDDGDVEAKVENYLNKIIQALTSTDIDAVKTVQQELKKLRQSGLDQNGEFSIENVAFKVLRAKGFIAQLQQHLYKLQDQALSLGEQNMKINQVVNTQQEAVEDRTSYQVAKVLFDNGVKYDSAREDELINVIGMVLVKKLDMSPRQARAIMNDEDFLGDTMGELRSMEQGVAEATGDKPFDSMMKTIKKGTAKQKTADRRAEKADSQQRARDAFGLNPAAGLGIRKPSVAEGSRDRRDAYQRDYDSSVGGMGNRDSYAYSQDGGGNDERHDLDPTDWYVVQDGKMMRVSVYPHQVDQARAKGYSPSREQARANAQESVAEEETMGKVSQATAKDVTIDNPDGTKTIAPLARLTKDPQGNLSLGKPVAGTPGATTPPGQEQQDKIQAGQQIRISTAEDLNHISRLAGLSK